MTNVEEGNEFKLSLKEFLSLGCADCFHCSPKTESRTHPLHPAGTGGKLTMILRFMSTSHLFYSSRRPFKAQLAQETLKKTKKQAASVSIIGGRRMDGEDKTSGRVLLTKQQLFVSSTRKSVATVGR